MDCREAGLNLELNDVAVQSLVPEPLQNVDSAAEFMQQLPQYDDDMARQVSDADAAGECLRFVGKSITARPRPSPSPPSPPPPPPPPLPFTPPPPTPPPPPPPTGLPPLPSPLLIPLPHHAPSTATSTPHPPFPLLLFRSQYAFRPQSCAPPPGRASCQKQGCTVGLY